MNITAFSYAVEYTWTGGDSTNPNAWESADNWNPNTGYPQNTDDDAIITVDSATTIDISNNININNITIGSNNSNLVTLNTNGNTLQFSKIILGNRIDPVYHSVSLAFTGNGNISSIELDMPNSGTAGYVFSVNIDNNTTLSVGTLYANSDVAGSPGFTFTGNGSLRANYIDAANSTGNTYSSSLTVSYGNWSLSKTRNDNIFRINIGNTTAFTSVYAEVTQINNDSTTSETYTGLPSTGTLSFTSAATQTIDITIPSLIDENDGFSITFYTDQNKNTTIGTIAYQADNPISTWNGTWDVTPWFATRKIVVASGATLSGFTDFKNAEIVNNGTIELTGSETNIAPSKITNGSGSTIKYTGTSTNIWGGSYENLVVSGSFTTNSSISINGSLTNNGTVSGTGNITISGDFTDNSTWNNTGTIHFTGTNNQLFTAKTGNNYSSINVSKTNTLTIDNKPTVTSLTLTSGDIIFNDDYIGGSITADSGNITFKGNYSGTGTFTASSGNTYFEKDADLSNGFAHNNGTVIIQNDSSQTFIKGDSTGVTFNNLTCTTPGKTINFEGNKTFTISNTLTITGDSSSKIILNSNDNNEWNLSSTNPSIGFVDIKNCKNTNTAKITLNDSTDSGNNTNFNFPGATYTWTGNDTTNNTNWFKNDNWSPNSVPGIGTNVKIPATTNYPILTDVLNDTTSVGSTGTIELTNASSKIDFNGFNVTVGTITNAGRIRLKGNETITATKINGTDSTIEYYDDFYTLPWGQSYQNLEFTGSATATIPSTSAITVTGKVKISTTGALDFYSGDNLTIGSSTISNSVTIRGGHTVTVENTISGNGNITLDGNLVDNSTWTNSGTIKFNGTTQTFTPNTSSTYNVEAATTTSLTVDSTATITTFTQISGNTTFNDAVTITTYADDTSSTGNVTFANGGSITNASGTTFNTTGDVTFGDTSSDTFTFGTSPTFAPITHTNGNTIINGTLNAADVIFYNTTINGILNITGSYSNTGTWTGNGKIKFSGATQTFTPNASSTYNIEAATTSSLTVNSPATITTFTQTSGNTTFSDAVTITSYADDTSSTGNITFSTTADITNNATFNTPGTITFGTTSNLAEVTHTTGNTVINGTINANKITLGATSITGANVLLNGTEIQTGALTTSALTNNLTCQASTGKITIAQLGLETQKFNTVTFDSLSSALDFTVTDTNLYATKVIFKSNNNNISLTGLTLSDELSLNTSAIVELHGINVPKLSFITSPSTLKLSDLINITGPDGFIIPLTVTDGIGVPVVLTDDTTIQTTTGPVTMYDNITGGYNFTVNNAGTFTFNDATSNSDIAQGVAVSSFSQTGSGATTIAGDIFADNTISFNSAITLSGELKITSGSTINIASTVDGTFNLTTISTGDTTFNGSLGNTTALGTISSTASNVVLNGTGLSVSATQFNITGNLLNTGSSISNTQINVSDSVENTGTFNNNSTISIQGNFTDTNGTWQAGAGTIILNGTGDQIFNPKTTTNYNEVVLNKTAGSVNFTDTTTIGTYTDTATSGDITFHNGGSIINATGTTFLTNGDVTFGDETTDTFTFGTSSTLAAVTHTNGNTFINGIFNAANITLNENTITGTLNAADISLGTTTFSGSINASKVTLNNGITVSSPSSITASSTDGLIFAGNGTFTGAINLTGNAKNTSNITADGTLNLSGDFTDTGTWTGSGKIKFNGTVQNLIASTTSTYNDIEAVSSTSLTVTNSSTITNFTHTRGTLTFSSPATITTFTQTSGNTTFSDAVTITTYNDNLSSIGNITFANGGSITNTTGTTFLTNGDVTFGDETTDTFTFGTSSAYADITHTTGNTVINGTINANKITLGATSITGANVLLNGTEIQTGALTTSASTNNLTCQASTGKITIAQLGLETQKFNTVTFDSLSSALDFTVTDTNLYATKVIFKSNNNNISLTGLTLSDELSLNTSAIVELHGIKVPKLTFETSPSNLKLSGLINITGADGFITPLTSGIGVTVVLTDNTIIESVGPITLFDNITGNYSLEIKNTGLFTFNDATSASDTDNGAVLGSFTQTGTGTTTIAGDIFANDSINFNSAITLDGDLKLSASSTININSTIDGTYNLITSSTENTTFNGSLGSSTTLGTINSTAENVILNGTGLSISGSQFNVTGTLSIPSAKTATLQIPLELTGQIINSGIFTTNENVNVSDLITNSGTFTTNNTVTTSTSITNTGTFTSYNTITVGTTLSNAGTFTSNAAITVNDSVENTGTFNNNSTLSIINNFTDTNGTWQTGVGTIILNGIGDQNYNPKPTTNYNEVIVNKTEGTVTITDDCIFTNFTITQNPKTIFNAESNIATLTITNASENLFIGSTVIGTYTDTNNAGKVTFQNDCTITNASGTTFLTNSDITFGDEITDTFTFGTSPTLAAVTHTTGKTIIIGTLNSGITEYATTNLTGTINSESLKCGQTTLGSNSVINATIGNIEFTDEISGVDYELTLNSPAEIIIKKTTLKKLTFDGNVATSVIKLSDLITTTDDIIIPFEVELIAPTTFNIANTLFNNDTQTNLGNYNLTVNGNVTIQGGNTFTSTSGNAIFTGNCTINANSKNVTFNAPITANNLYLYGANLILKKNITTQNDLVLFGNNYNTTDQQSGNTGIYIYKYNATPTATAGSLQTDGTITVKAGRNFYANGITATSTGEWNLQLKANLNTIENYAQAYYCNFSASQCRVSSFNSTEANAVMIEEEECTVANGYETGWDLEEFIISDSYTVDDDIICIEFNRPVRNIEKILTQNTNRILFSDGVYLNAYIDSNCTTELPENSTEYSKIYLKAEKTWNTDATGTSIGNSVNSTDKENVHKEIKPYIDVKRNVISGDDTYSFFVTDLYGKRLKLYSHTDDDSFNIYDLVHDKCNPVFTVVKTGQEIHELYNTAIGITSQHSYDAHNFIEFTYSEPVNFGSQDTTVSDIWIPARNSDNSTFIVENIQVTDSFAAATTDITANAEAGFTLQGLGTIENGRIYTGANGETNKYVNSLYRDNQYSIRLSIAGYTDGTVTDRSGNIYKKWVGYIENAQTPSGSVTIPAEGNPLVTDLIGNIQMPVPEVVNITINSTTNGEYGKWDTSEPVFAPLRLQSTTSWSECYHNNYTTCEAVGNTSGTGSTLDRIEFHLFDNTPGYSTDEFAWLTEKGWCFNTTLEGRETLYKETYSYCADIFGGSRPFDNNANTRTHGGIRFSTISNASNAFKYIDNINGTPNPTTSFANATTITGAKAGLFTGSSTQRRAANELDGLYFGLELAETNYPIDRSFTISFNENDAFITDLAGNRLRSAVIKTIDRTPPAYNFILGPLNKNELYMVFVKELVKPSNYIDNNGDAHEIDEELPTLLPSCFEIIGIDKTTGQSISQDAIQIDYTQPAQIEKVISNVNSQTFTIVKLKLTENITLSSIENLYIRTKNATNYPEFSQDPVTGLQNSRVTFIQDSLKNYMQMYDAHALSDFAISTINPLYAYDMEMTYDEETIMDGLYETGSWAVHDWNAEQQNYGTLPANHPYDIVAEMDDGTAEKQNMPAGVRIYLSDNPTQEAISKQYNSDLNQNLRIWLPEVTDGLFPFLALTNNAIGNYYQTDSTILNEEESLSRIHFEIPKEITKNWGSNKQISFLFGLLDSNAEQIRIISSPLYDVTNNRYNIAQSKFSPLYALRLKDQTDISSIDLWSFKTRSITEQRGGVTILNNVINPLNGEKVAIKVNMPSEGKLNVMIMTLDGNIITYLNHGNTTEGEHYYSWNGTNRNGKAVGRGMYFVRVVGNGIDETRKVMVVK